jgi:hypothetical protein
MSAERRAPPNWWVLALVIALLALAASANSVVNGFTYDDGDVILHSERIHSLHRWWREFGRTYWEEQWGGDGYRPLSILAFRAEWVVGSGSPSVFHAVNVALHVATSVVVFWLACALLPLNAAWIAAALYSVHPVHVEAIANVVGQSELWVAFLVTLAVGLYVHGRRRGAITLRRWIAIGVLYAAACLFKEHGIVLPAILLLAELTVVLDSAPLTRRLVAVRPAMLALAAIGLTYLWARSRVVVGGGAGFVPYIAFQVLKFSAGDRVLTMIGAAPEWLRLLLWPARLIAEYSPPALEIAQGPSITQLPGLLVLIGILGLIVVCWRRSPVTSFGLAWLVVALLPASNFLIPAGFIIAERTLLLPSAGAIIAVASAVPWIYAHLEQRRALRAVAAFGVVLLLALGLGRSYTRNRVWHDNDTLFRQTVLDAPESYHAHYILGTHLFENRRLREGEVHYRRALELFPYDHVLIFALANQYRHIGKCDAAIPLFRSAFSIAPTYKAGLLELSECLLYKDPFESKRVALLAVRLGAPINQAHTLIVAAHARRTTAGAGGSR